MKPQNLILLLTGFAIVAVLHCACDARSSKPTMLGPKIHLLDIAAPFDMPAIMQPDFSELPQYSIIDYGAKLGDQEANSQAIASAIKAANAAGGGRVVVPAGKWETGPIHFKDNIDLHLEEEAILSFSPNPSDYLPAVKTTWEGMECYNYSPLIYAYCCRNVAITGKGKLRANLDVWKIWYARPKPHMEALKHLYEMASKGVPVINRQMATGEANLRPQFIQFNRCHNVLLEGISIENSPFWVIHPFLCKDVVIRGVHVNARGHNNDGVDPEMSQNVLIEDCIFNQGDDAIAIKSGRNQDAWRLNTPSRNIVVRNCHVKNGHQLVAIGSELSGGVENVLVEDCTIDKRISSIGHLLYIKTNERRGGFARNIYMHRISAGSLRYGILGIETDVLYQWKKIVPTYEVKLTKIQNIHITDINVDKVQFASRIEAQKLSPVENVSMQEVSAQEFSMQEHLHKNVVGFTTTPLVRSASDKANESRKLERADLR